MLISVGVLLLLLLQPLACAGQSVLFQTKYAMTNLTGRVGHSVSFAWTFSGGVDTVSWALANDAGTDIDKTLVSLDVLNANVVQPGLVPGAYRGRVNGTRTGGSSFGQASFILYDVTKNDERFYGCSLTADGPDGLTIYDFVQLVVVGPPNIAHVSHNQTANEGDKVILNCTADGNPPPNITWTRLSSNSYVTFPMMVSKRDEGGYRCTADNGFGIKIRDVFITVQYAATVEMVAPVTSHSWIGQTVKLTCTADGSPTPTLSWKSPSGRVIKQEKELKTTVDVLMKTDKDFGNYTCEATNDVNTDTSTVLVQQIKAPGSPTFTVDIEATSIRVRWTKPADDGGSPITAYRVLILRGNTEIENENITDTSVKHQDIGGLNKSTNYTIKLFARNYVFEGKATERKIQTKYEGVPSAVAFTYELKADEITLKWEEPNNNGVEITMYTVYYGTQSDEQWKETEKITDVSVRKYVVKVEMGQKYKVLVTASNKYGESSKEGKMQRVDVPEDVQSPKGGSPIEADVPTNGGSSSKTKTVVTSAAGGGLLLLILAITITI